MHWVAHKISSKWQLRLFRAKEPAKTILTIELLKIGRLKADHVRSKAQGHRHRPLDEAACIRDFAKTHAWRRVVDAPVPAVTAFSHCLKDMIRVALGALENKKMWLHRGSYRDETTKQTKYSFSAFLELEARR